MYEKLQNLHNLLFYKNNLLLWQDLTLEHLFSNIAKGFEESYRVEPSQPQTTKTLSMLEMQPVGLMVVVVAAIWDSVSTTFICVFKLIMCLCEIAMLPVFM